MAEPGAGAAEHRQASERFSVGERSVRLGNQNDAVCDGKTVRLSALERSRTDTKDVAEQSMKNAQDLAARISSLKKTGSADLLFPKPPNADRLLNLSTELEGLTKDRFAGLLVNIQSAQLKDAGATSIGMFALVDYLSAHQADTTSSSADILKGAHAAVQSAYKALGIREPPAFAAVLIDVQGTMTSVHSKDVAVVIIDNDAKQPTDKVKKVADGSEPQARKVKKGEKIILCSQEAASRIGETNKPVTEIVDSLSKPKDKEREKKPISGNIIYTRHATIIPDIHGGKEVTDPTRKGNESPLSAFTQKGRPGELFVSAGDVFDRGANSWKAATEMMHMVQNGEAVWNWGNHELLFMATMSGDKKAFSPANAEALSTWFMNGGDQMARAAGVDMTVYDKAVADAGNPMAFFQNRPAREACWQTMLPALRGNKGLNDLSTFLEQHGKAYTIVDNVLVTHAGVLADPRTGGLMDVTIDGQNYGKGLLAMDKIQGEVRKGNAKVINWLANHGGNDTLNAQNPFWVRGQNFQEVAQNPGLAHNLRAELNAQLTGKTQIELIVVGHTPSMADTAGMTMPLGNMDDLTRFVFADTGYHNDGEPRVVRLTVPQGETNAVVAVYEDPITGKRPPRADGKAVVDSKYPMDRSLPQTTTQGAAGETMSAGGTGRPDAVSPVAVHHEVYIPKRSTYEDDMSLPPVKVEDYITTSEYQQNKAWLGRVIESVKTSPSTDPKIQELKQKPGEDELSYTRRVVKALQTHLANAGENENSALSGLARVAVADKENRDIGGELTTLDAVAVLLDKAPGLYDSKYEPVPPTPKKAKTTPPRKRVNQTTPAIEAGRGRKAPFYEDRSQESEFDVRVADVAKGTVLQEQVSLINTFLGKPETQTQLTAVVGPKQAGESDGAYRVRTLTVIADIVKNQGSYEGLPAADSKRQLLTSLSKEGIITSDFHTTERNLVAAEALIEISSMEENKQIQEAYDKEHKALEDKTRAGRYNLTTEEETRAGDIMAIMGSERMFNDIPVDANGKVVPGSATAERARKNFADRELIASALVSEYLMDIPFRQNPDGKTQTFREVMKDINDQRALLRAGIASEDAGAIQKFRELSKQARDARMQFYTDAYTMFENRLVAQNAFEANSAEATFFAKQAREAWQKLGEDPQSLAKLTEHFFAVRATKNQAGKNQVPKVKQADGTYREMTPQEFADKVRKIFKMTAQDGRINQLASYAFEGIDFMKRKTQTAITLEKRPLTPKPVKEIIRQKKFVKSGQEQGGSPTPVAIEEEDEEIPPPEPNAEKKPDLGTIRQKICKENENRDTLIDLAGPDAAPVVDREGKPETEPKPGTDLDAAPVKPKPPGPGKTPPIVVETESVLAMTAVKGRYINSNDHNTDHMMSRERAQRYWYSRIPLLGGLIGSIHKPVQNIWRNGLFRESTREQNRRFVDKMDMSLKAHLIDGEAVDGQMRIPVELTSELLDKALAEGRKLRKEQGFFTRLWWSQIANPLARITALGETAEMHFARQWLEDQFAESRSGSRDQAIENIFNRALAEQNEVGQRMGLIQRDKDGKIMTDPRALYIGLREGEKRDWEATQSPVIEATMKKLVEGYFSDLDRINAITDVAKRNRQIQEARVRLVARMNTESVNLRDKLSSNYIDFKSAPEFASNILSIVDDLATQIGETGKSKWQVLKDQDQWKDYRIRVLAAEARWGGEGEGKRISGLREKVLLRMAERELFADGSRAQGVGLAGLSIASDIATYGGAYALGLGINVATFGASTASKLVGGFAGVMGMSAIKEGGLRIGGLELVRGRYRGEVAQVSREIALGKKSPTDATIRKEMGRALVDNVERADAISDRIEGLMKKDISAMTEAEALQLLREIAQLDARMRIADISGSKNLQFTTQNYIVYDELKRNEQYFRLKSNILSGLQKLSIYKDNNKDFGGSDDLFTGTRLDYGTSQGTLGMFEKFSALAEAQLRVGTRAEVVKWLAGKNNIVSNNAGLGMESEAKKLVDAYYADAKGEVRREQSIREKEKVLRKLATKRAVTVVLQSALMMPIGGVIIGAEYQLFSGIAQEVQHAVREGLPAWGNEWGGIINGTAVPAAGHVLSPFQDAVLSVRHTVEGMARVDVPPAHDEVIDGVHIQLPGEYKYVPGPNGHDRIVDLDGNTVKDLSQIDLHIINGKLVETDAAGQTINGGDAVLDFKASGISLHEIADAKGATSHTETIIPATAETTSVCVDGHYLQTPVGTTWIKDAGGHNDLVVTGHPDVVLIDNAKIESDGSMTGYTLHSGVKIDEPHVRTGGETTTSTQEIKLTGDGGKFDANHDTFNIHTDRLAMSGGTEENGFAYHRPVYDYRETNTTTHDAVYVIQAGRGDIFYKQDPSLVFHVPQEMAEGHLYFTITVPGHGDLAIPANYSAAHDSLQDALRLDPSDINKFKTPQGNEYSYGEIARMFVDQKNLSTHPDGNLGTEFNSLTHEILHLTPEGATHPGTITSSILHDGKLYDFGAVRGQAPLHDVTSTSTITTPVVDTICPKITIDSSIEGPPIIETYPLYAIDPPPVTIPPLIITIPLIVPPMGRVNVEAAESGITPQDRVIPPSGPATQTPGAAVPGGAPELTEQEKRTIQAEVDSRAYASADAMLLEFGLKQYEGFGKHGSDEEKRAANARLTSCQEAMSGYEKARRELATAQENDKKQKENAYKEARKKLIKAMKATESGATFGDEEIAALDGYLDNKRKAVLETERQKRVDAKRKKEEEEGGGEGEAGKKTTAESTVTIEAAYPKLTARFARVQAEPELGHKYAVATVPSAPISANLTSLELPETFYIPEGAEGHASLNKNVAPFVLDLGDAKPEGERNERFMNAEASTNGDSGVFALAAASAETPEKQAQLYGYLTGTILAVHKNNPQLLTQWLKAQSEISKRLFVQFDMFKDKNTPRTELNEKLLVVNGTDFRDLHATINNEETAKMWVARIGELEQALKADNIQEHQIRWIEFLAHSVKIPEVIQAAQGTK